MIGDVTFVKTRVLISLSVSVCFVPFTNHDKLKLSPDTTAVSVTVDPEAESLLVLDESLMERV